MNFKRLLGAICAGLIFVTPVMAAEQASFVTPVAGPMNMAAFAGTYLNPALRALGSCSWGVSSPVNGPGAAPLPYQCWADTTTNPVVFKVYDGASWVTAGKLNTSTHLWTPSYQGTDLGTVSTATSGTGGHTVPFLDGTNIWSGPQRFNSGDLQLNGNSSGTGTLNAPAAASSFVWTLPSATDTLIGKGTATAITSFGLRSTGAAFDVRFAATEVLTADRTLTWVLGDASRSITLGGNVSIGGAFTLSGSFGFTGTLTGTTSVTFPTAGTLATLAGTETFTNKTFVCANQTSCVVRLASDVSGTLPLGNGGSGQTTAAAARTSSGYNIDQFTGHGDSIYSILATDRTVGTNAAFTASRTWTLPAANAVNPGQEIVVADFQGTVTGSNTLVIARAGSDTINGGTTATISAANGSYLLKSDGVSKWTAQALGAATGGGVTSVTCFGVAITTSGTCTTAATKSDEQTGSSITAVVTPSQQHQHDSAIKAWVTFNTVGTIVASYNVTSVGNPSTGVYQINFTTSFAGTGYACTTMAGNAGYMHLNPATKAAGNFQLVARDNTGAASNTGGDVSCYGRQ